MSFRHCWKWLNNISAKWKRPASGTLGAPHGYGGLSWNPFYHAGQPHRLAH